MVDNLDARLDAEGGPVDQWLRLMRARAVLQQEEQATDVLTRALSAFEGDEAARDRLLTEADALGLAPSED
jgi:cytochrome c-type biogenesis protein CcmH